MSLNSSASPVASDPWICAIGSEQAWDRALAKILARSRRSFGLEAILMPTR